MVNHSTDNWSLHVGRLSGVELRAHILWPLLAVVLLLVVQTGAIQPSIALWAAVVLAGSVALHELARVVTASRVGGHTNSLVLGPVGGLTKLHLPIDPPAHLVTALAGPMTYLVLLVTAGCGLALTEKPDIIPLLLNPCSIPNLAPVTDATITLHLLARLVVWVNWCLLLISFLPVDPFDGAELLRGALWPMVGRTTASIATSRIALGVALFFALLAMAIPESESRIILPFAITEGDTRSVVPPWFPLAIMSVLLFYGGFRRPPTQRYDVGLAIDEFDSDDEEWLLNDWEEDDREAVLVEHLQDKQQEVLDRKRREREASEDARVDAILVRLRNSSFNQLSEEDQATLKRASRRYRQRRETQDDQN